MNRIIEFLHQIIGKQGMAIEDLYNLGMQYYEGKDIDYTKSVRWLRKAAKQGHAEAQFHLGGSYAQGEGTKKNWTKAISQGPDVQTVTSLENIIILSI